MTRKHALDFQLIDPENHTLEFLRETVLGSYKPKHFILTLAPRIHELINAVPTGIYQVSDLGSETVQAYSTYLHETVHWWQHMGSTAGLITSLSYPAQTYASLEHLREFLSLAGPKKSIKLWSENAALSGTPTDDPALAAAFISVNNAVDIEYYRAFCADPSIAETINQEKYFECIGHSYHMAYQQVLNTLSASIDREFNYIPDIRKWDAEFRRLAEAHHEGFFYGSPIRRGHVGMRAIFEGQARLIQAQFLAFSSGNIPFKDLAAAGYFDGVYGEAFYAFLEISQSDPPEYIDDPLVAVFLLICDLAINPSSGFPLNITNFQNFFVDVDPGIRFGRLCAATKDNILSLKKMCAGYSKTGYRSASQLLSISSGYDDPIVALAAIVNWSTSSTEILKVMSEKETFKYQPENLPIRVLFHIF